VRRAARRTLGALALSALVAALTTLLVFTLSYLVFPVSEVRLEGARMLPESRVKELVGERASLLTLNTGALERRVESDPWVYSARVSKNWDSSIVTVEVEERTAILRAVVEGRERFYSADGVELPGAGGARLPELRLERWQVEEILGVVGVLEEGGVRIRAVESAGAGGVFVSLGSGQRAVLSGGVSEEQVAALREIMASYPGAEYFDLRSPGRVIVGLDGAREE
jgi:hypothetical protein